MKIKNSFFSALFGLAAVVGLVACSSDDYERIGAPDGSQVFFSSETPSEYLLAENQNQVEIVVNRIKTDGASTVNVKAKDESGLFTVATTASFAAGEATTKIPVTFDFAKLESDTDYKITLDLEGETCDYGDKTKTVVIKYAPWSDWAPYGWSYPSTIKTFEQWEDAYAKASTYNEVAKGGVLPTYTYNAYYGGDGAQPVFFRQSQLNPTQVQLLLYDWGSGINLVINWDKAKGEFTCPETYFTNNDNYGAVYVSDAVTYRHGKMGKNEDYSTYPSAFDEETGKFTFYIAYYVSAGWFGAGPEFLQLPGYEKADYSLKLEDKGVASKAGSAIGEVVNFTFGADLGSVKYATFEGTLTEEQIAAKASAIVDGSEASTTTRENGMKTISVAGEGLYTLVAALYDNDGNYQDYTSLAFEVKNPGGAETWTPIFLGDFTYSLIFTEEDGSPYVDKDLVLYQSDADENRYKIEHWGYDVDFIFTMDEKGGVVVEDQFTGLDDSQVGEVWVMDYMVAAGKPEPTGYYENGTFNFSLVYYYGESIINYGTETFKLTANAAKALEQSRAKAKAKNGMKTKSVKAKKSMKNLCGNKSIFLRGQKPSMK